VPECTAGPDIRMNARFHVHANPHRRTTPWPAWPRRASIRSGDYVRNSIGGRRDRKLDWPLLAFWGGYLTLFWVVVWLFVR
jgi:hypothetical protein